MRGETAVPAVADLRERDVEGARALLLKLVVIEVGALAEHHLGHGIGEVHLVREAGVGLDDGGPAALAQDDQVARLRQRRLRGRGRKEQEMDRPLQLRPGGKVDERAVLDEGRVERGERVVLVIGVAGQLPIDQLGPFHDRGGQRSDESTAGALGARRQLRLVAAVEEHQADSAVSGWTSGQQIKLPEGHRGGRCLRLGSREGDLCEWSKARVLPLFVLHGGKAQLREAGEGRLAEQPETSDPTGRLAESREALAQAASEVRHRAASPPARPGREGGSNWAYPFCSSSSASSRPPDLTMRPLLITCTRSGTMYSSSRW